MREGFFRAVSTVEFTNMLRQFAPLAGETVDLDEACGRSLAADIVAAENLPAAVLSGFGTGSRSAQAHRISSR